MRLHEGTTMSVFDYENSLSTIDSMVDLTDGHSANLQGRDDISALLNVTEPAIGDAPPWNVSTADVDESCEYQCVP
jgi:hypothetical protein